MAQKLKRPMSFLLALVVTMVFHFPIGITNGINGIFGFGLPAKAAETIELTQPSGSGTSTEPYLIDSKEKLYWFANHVNSENNTACAKLTADIVVNEGEIENAVANCGGTKGEDWKDWTPIGKNLCTYKGTFDGDRHTISGLYFNDTATNYVGLFGYMGRGGSVSNVGVVDSYFNGNQNVGGVCGYNYYGTIKNCYNSSTVSGSNLYVGGVCGRNDSGTIENCYNSGTVNGTYDYVSGVCGWNNNGTIKNCYNTGTVSSEGSYVGGVCGKNNGNITSCYSTGTVSSSDSRSYVGDVCGDNGGGISRCYYLDSDSAIGGIEKKEVLGSAESKTATQFKSGEVCYLLQGKQAEQVWGQTKNQDDFPVLSSDTNKRVYINCSGEVEYTNVASSNHDYSNGGLCRCGAAQKPEVDAADGYYKIANASNLYWFANYVNSGNTSACAKLTENIVVNKGETQNAVANCNGTKGADWTDWTPIGSETNPYTGTFTGKKEDGSSYTISGLYFNDNAVSYVGLFGYIGTNETATDSVSNVGVVDSYFNGSQYVGGVCGYNNSGAIKSCYNSGTVSGYQYVGGVCGSNSSTIENCYNSGTVSGSSYVGSVCGSNSGTIKSCYNSGTVSGSRQHVGGVCGMNKGGTIKNCHNTVAVSGSGYVGGVCGYNCSSGKIENCHNTGTVSGNSSSYENVGGVCGYNGSNSEIENCYNIASVSSKGAYVGGVCGCNYSTSSGQGSIKSCYNTGKVSSTYNSTSKYVGGVCGSNSGTLQSCYYLDTAYNGGINDADITESAESKTDTQFKSGEVCYLLNGRTSEGTLAWGQDLSNENSYPVIGGNTVYITSPCVTYSNDNSGTDKKHGVFTEDGFCPDCGLYQPATETTDTHDIDGDGTKDKVYEISNEGQLYWFAALVNGTLIDGTAQNTAANAVLIKDIVVNKGDNENAVANCNGTKGTGWKDWTPIGSETKPYTGTFTGKKEDGSSYTISGLYFKEDRSYVGLFGYIGTNETATGRVSNVGVVDSYFNGNQYVGGVCGYNNSGTIKSCSNSSTVNGTGNYVGGVCGYNNSGTIESCSNSSAVNGTGDNVGGVCGNNSSSGTIKKCHNTGTVNGNYRVGGVCGDNNKSCTIENCYNTGTVSGTGYYVGGVCGYNNNYSKIENCYNTGTASGLSYVGSVCSSNYGTITNCYYLAEDKTETTNGITGKTAKQFKSGEVCCLLNGSTSSGTPVWGQDLSNENYPVIDGKTVYITSPCISYSNTENNNKAHTGLDGNGFCTVCSGYDVPKVVSAENYPELNETHSGYYAIENVGQLYWFVALVNGTLIDGTAQNTAANAVLIKDIVVNKGDTENAVANCNGTKGTGWKDWTPIGSGNKPYTGTFNGNGKTISGLYFNDSSSIYVGLFGYIEGGSVSNVGVVDSYFNGNDFVGGVCGYKYSGTITNSYNTGTVIKSGSANATDNAVGGVCGYNRSGTIENCYNTGTVTEATVIEDGTTYEVNIYIGGVCGCNSSTIKSCYNTGTVTENVQYTPSDNISINVGGVCGFTSTYSSTINCYYLDTCAGVGTTFNGLDATSKTDTEFKSGEVCYLLNGSTSEGTLAWGQDLSDKNSYPVIGGKKVYKTSPCVSYTNTENNDNGHGAELVNGFCPVCGLYEEPKLVSDTHHSELNETHSGYYAIENAGQLYWFAAIVNGDTNVCIDGVEQNTKAKAVLTNNIIVNENVLIDGKLNSEKSSSFKSWTPIGKEGNNENNAFKGIFDGNGKTISGLYFNNLNSSYVGLFGYAYASTIKNIGVVDSYFYGDECVGGVCGRNDNISEIVNCYNTGLVSGSSNVGGVCGEIVYGPSIINCYNTGSVSGSSNVGSVCGRNFSANITNCYYLADTASTGIGENTKLESIAVSKTATEFASGEVCYLLNNNTSVWRQNIDSEKDTYPVLDSTHGTVYPCTPCTGVYSNTEGKEASHTDSGIYDENGFGSCTVCGAVVYEPATLNDTVYEIGNAGQLYWFADKVKNDYATYKSANAVLTADIIVNTGIFDESGNLVSDTSGLRSWTPIGWYDDVAKVDYSYIGTFDGQGHTISGLYFNNTSADYVGLFGVVGTNGSVSNVGIVDSYFSGRMGVGGVCGAVNGSTITNCYNTSTVSGNMFVGGVCGDKSSNSTITNCYYLAESETETTNGITGKTDIQFANGEVCYLLNGDQKVLVWGQTLGENGNDYPVFKTAENTVYYGYDGCEATVQTYSNKELRKTMGHSYTGPNNACVYCGTAFAIFAANYAAIGTDVAKAHEVDADGTIGSEVDVNVTADTGVVTCYFTLNGSETSFDTYTLEIFKNDETKASEQTGKVNYKKKLADNTAVDINTIQIVYALENDASYKVKLTLYKGDNAVFTDKKTVASSQA